MSSYLVILRNRHQLVYDDVSESIICVFCYNFSRKNNSVQLSYGKYIIIKYLTVKTICYHKIFSFVKSA